MFAASETIDVTDAKKLAADFGLSDREYTHVEKPLDGYQQEPSLVSSLVCGANTALTSQPSIG